jgi:hypothetical protein
MHCQRLSFHRRLHGFRSTQSVADLPLTGDEEDDPAAGEARDVCLLAEPGAGDCASAASRIFTYLAYPEGGCLASHRADASIHRLSASMILLFLASFNDGALPWVSVMGVGTSMSLTTRETPDMTLVGSE